MKDHEDTDIPMFRGTVDELLMHSMSIDPEMVEEKIESEMLIQEEDNRREWIADIMAEDGCSEDEAVEMYEMIQKEYALLEVKRIVDELVAAGIAEIVGYDSEGEPLFGLKGEKKLFDKPSKKPKKKD